AFRTLGEAGETPTLPQRTYTVAALAENLVRIGLVADIPYQPVLRRVEDVMQRDRQLDDAEPGAEMPTRHRHRVDGLEPQFIGKLAKFALGQLAKVFGRTDRVEKRRLWHFQSFTRQWAELGS